MGFYLRKAFRFGPLRLNLSQHGIGASAGVTGARVGLMPGGRVYTHAGRYGLYHRRVWGQVGSDARSRPAGPPREWSVDTELTYGNGSDPGEPAFPATIDLPPVGRPDIATPIVVSLILVAAVFASTTGRQTEPVWALMSGLGLVAAVVWAVRRSIARDHVSTWLEHLDSLAEQPAADWPRQREALRELTLRKPLSPASKRDLGARAYLDLCLAAVLDGHVTPAETARLAGVAAAFDLDPATAHRQRAQAYRAVLLESAADRELDTDETHALDRVRAAFAIEPADVPDEAEYEAQLVRLRTLRHGDLPAVDLPPDEHRWLRDGETCHLRAPARLLRERVLRRFQRDGQRHVVRGLTLHREGTLLLTDRRLLLLGEERTEIPLRAVVECELDVDRRLLVIDRSDRKNPVHLTTPDADAAAVLVARLAGL